MIQSVGNGLKDLLDFMISVKSFDIVTKQIVSIFYFELISTVGVGGLNILTFSKIISPQLLTFTWSVALAQFTTCTDAVDAVVGQLVGFETDSFGTGVNDALSQPWNLRRCMIWFLQDNLSI